MSGEEGNTGETRSGGKGPDFYTKRDENITPENPGYPIGYTDAIEPLTEQQATESGSAPEGAPMTHEEGLKASDETREALWGPDSFIHSPEVKNLVELEGIFTELQEGVNNSEALTKKLEEIQARFRNFLEENKLEETFDKFKEGQTKPETVEGAEPKTDSATSTAPQDNQAT